MERRQDIGEELFMIFHKRLEKVSVCPSIDAQSIGRDF
jgi:hypothetical protein